MGLQGFPWVFVGLHGASWNSFMFLHEYPRVSMGNYGPPIVFKGLHGSPCVFMDLQGYSNVLMFIFKSKCLYTLKESSCVFMGIRGSRRVSKGTHVYPWVSIDFYRVSMGLHTSSPVSMSLHGSSYSQINLPYLDPGTGNTPIRVSVNKRKFGFRSVTTYDQGIANIQ